ncbi:MAG TPA: SDR family oxidoreductase [Chloroflexota bacterium]|nr:SDR family oxidoreductase [Chloroflexota bacterium]
MTLAGRVALVTGGGTGLGRAIALGLGREGANLAINYSRSRDEALATVKELESLGVQARAIQADVSEVPEARRLVRESLEVFGRLDVLVNNAGRTAIVPMNDLEGVSDDEWDAIMALNVKTPWVLARAAAEALRATRGCIVNVSSISGLRPAGSSLAYCVSKAALLHLTRCLAVALAPEVRVNAIAPGFMPTRWGMRFGDELDSIAASSALQRLVPAEDAARAAIELICNESITGETIVVDAGLLLTS